MISTQFKLEAECKLLTVTLLVATAICACLTFGLVKVSKSYFVLEKIMGGFDWLKMMI